MNLKRNWLKIFIAINLLAALYGFVSFYGQQLLKALFVQPLTLVFIPDCPLFALLMGLALIFLIQGKQKNLFYFLTFAGCLKYGFWTLAVLTFFSGFYFSQNFFLYALLFIGHAGLLAETLLLLGRFDSSKKFLVPVLGFFLLNDFSDYWLATHPPLPKNSLLGVFAFSLLLSLVAVALTVLLGKKVKRKIISIDD